jgi:hypothetical protein
MIGIDLVAIDEARRLSVEAGNVEDLLDLLLTLREVKSEFDLIVRDVEDDCARLMRRKHFNTPQLTAERWAGGLDRRNWQSKDLARKIIADGDFDHPQDVADMLFELAAVSYWRVTKLRELGIDPDEFCDSAPGRATVSVKRREKTVA